MKKLIPIFILLLLPFTINAQFNDEITLYSVQVDLNEFNPGPLTIKKVILKALMQRGWQIIEHSKIHLKAEYRNFPIKISIRNQIITIQEIETLKQNRIQKSWLASLKVLILRDMQYYRYVKEAEAQLGL